MCVYILCGLSFSYALIYTENKIKIYLIGVSEKEFIETDKDIIFEQVVAEAFQELN